MINVVARCIFTVNVVVKLKSRESESEDEILHPDLFNASSLLSSKGFKICFPSWRSYSSSSVDTQKKRWFIEITFHFVATQTQTDTIENRKSALVTTRYRGGGSSISPILCCIIKQSLWHKSSLLIPLTKFNPTLLVHTTRIFAQLWHLTLYSIQQKSSINKCGTFYLLITE